MVRACSEVREALAKVSSSTNTALLRSSFWRESRFEAISVRFAMAPLHLSSLPLPLISFSFSFSCSISIVFCLVSLRSCNFLNIYWAFLSFTCSVFPCIRVIQAHVIRNLNFFPFNIFGLKKEFFYNFRF